jgi:hypothetical protein
VSLTKIVRPRSLTEIAAAQGYAPGNHIALVNCLVGRVVWKNNQNYTVTSAESTNHDPTPRHLVVYDPVKNTVLLFDDLETFENWAYGTPVASGASR